MSKPLVWGGYLRISEDPDDLRQGVRRQHEDIAEAIARQGGELDPSRLYDENDTSAFKKRRVSITDEYGEQRFAYRVIRPRWAEAMRDLRSGVVTALMVYDLDRLARDPRDLEDAIEAVEHYGAVVLSATSSTTDLSTSSGQAMARVMVAMATKSSADTARRVARAHLANARIGKPVGGSRPFGFLPDKVTPDPVESALVRKAIEDVLAGASLRSIAEQWGRAGVPTVRGAVWSRGVIRRLLANPRLAGWRVYRDQIAVDKDGSPVRMIDPATGEPAEPLIDQDTFDRLQLVLTQPDNRAVKPRRGGRRYMLSGIVRCAVCQRVMYGNRHGGSIEEPRFYYVCQGRPGDKHTVSVSGRATDEFVERLVLRRLAAEPVETPEVVFSGDGRLEVIRAAIRELMEAHRTGQLSGALVFPQVQQLEQEREQLDAERRAFIRETAGPPVDRITPEQWEEMGTDKRRAVVFTLIDAMLVRPNTKPQRNWMDYERLEVVWRER